MRRKLLMLMLAIALLPALAMAAPDFNGTWTLNKAGSDPAPNLMYWLTRAGPTMGGGRGNAEVTITVHQDAKGMQVADAQTARRDYMLDGKPHSRATDTGVEKAVVTANLAGDNLVIETEEPYGGMPGNATLKTKEAWSLSADGKTLTITTSRDVPAKHETYKQVYTRTQAQPGAICSAGCVVPQ
jgi:hypothetical protein